MSSELFLQCFRDKHLHHFPVEVIERAFGAVVASRDSDEDGRPDSLWHVNDSLGGRGELHLRYSADDGSMVSGVMLNGVSGAVFDRMFDIIKETRAVVYWPGGTRYVVAADVDLATDLPDNFLDIFPAALAVRSGAELKEQICG